MPPRKTREILSGLEENQDAAIEPENQAPPAQAKRRFVSNFYPTLGLCVGRKYVRFNGDLITDDPEIIRAIETHPWFGLFIHRG